MTVWSKVPGWRRLRALLLTLSGFLPAIAAAAAAPVSVSETEQTSTEQQIAAYHPSNIAPPTKASISRSEKGARGRIAEARQLLMELQVLIEETARTVDLDNRLKVRKKENEQLKEALSTSRAANTTFESKVRPTEQVRSALTRSIVRNWLQTVQLQYRVDEADRELITSENSRSKVQERVAALRRDLVTRHAEVQRLRTKVSALSNELKNTRLQVKLANKAARQFEHQQDLIIAAISALRRELTSRLLKLPPESRL